MKTLNLSADNHFQNQQGNRSPAVADRSSRSIKSGGQTGSIEKRNDQSPYGAVPINSANLIKDDNQKVKNLNPIYLSNLKFAIV